MNLNYIIDNDEINIKNKSLKIINIYNIRLFEDTSWYNILFTQIPINVQDLLKVIYDCKIKFNIVYMTILKQNNLLEKFYNTENQLNLKTFIKYFFDNNILEEDLLIELSEETDIYKCNNPFAIIFNYHNLSEDFSLKKNDINNIIYYKNKNKYHDNQKYYLIKTIKTKNNENIFYTQELIKINNQWWLVTTKWNKFYYKRKENKVIIWIFSEVV